MRLKSIELSGFKSFAKKTKLEFGAPIVSIVGPNGSGKSNVAESFRFVLGEQSIKSMRGKRGEDLIWNGSTSLPRAGRAGVKLVFDNLPIGGRRALNLDFDEVSLERVVHRGGQNDYLLNGSQVRLRDIAGLLSGANIGASGHHIISQGEADRILSSSSRERREMVEDALGLTGYLYKREEAERKLEKAAEHMHEVMSLRRELAPHLKFLGSQVKKIEDAQKLRDEIADNYTEYLGREHVYIKAAHAELVEERGPLAEREALDKRIARLRQEVGKKHAGSDSDRLLRLEQHGRVTRARREALVRELGGVEGELRAHARLGLEEGTVPVREARDFGERILRFAEGAQWAELIALARAFLKKISGGGTEASSPEGLEEKKRSLEAQSKAVEADEGTIVAEVSRLRHKIESEKDAGRDAERQLFAAMAQRSELEGAIVALHAKEQALHTDEARFREELREAAALLGRVPQFEGQALVFEDEPRAAQEDRRRKLERLKIRLEEAGLGNSREVLQEHRETSERDAFLARELSDLEISARSLRTLIEELTETLKTRFSDGLERINKEFSEFFKLMFGGGSASLALIKEQRLKRRVEDEEGENSADEEDTEVEEGVEIAVNLPHKRVKGLHMLSGGERALTSIALIFAMSQVNPPPFLVLDETDAALDEANSRRYGDMIESLAKKSQLILITHNRETMSRAGILYGVTMGADGISKLLSVKFEEALAVAK